jgi:spermidine synthase
VVVRDVFARGEVPRHVRTVEAARSAHRVLTADGLYLVNLTDHPPLHRARAEVAALQDTFTHVLLIADPAILRGRRYGNVLLAASAAPLPVAALDRALRRLPLPVRLVEGSALRDFRGSVPAAHDETAGPPQPAPAG